MADLKVDLDQLERLQSRLNSALALVDDELENSIALGAAVGDSRLAGHIHGFSTSWNKHRFDIRDNLVWLKDSVDKIGDSFTDIDEELASALSQKAPPASQTSGQVV